VVSGGHGNTYTVWKLDSRGVGSRKQVTIPKVGEQSDVWCIAISPDGRRLVTGHMDSSITIWDLERRKQKHSFYVSDASTMAALFSPDGAVFATAQQNGRIYFWNPESGRRMGELRAHEGGVESLAFDTSGSFALASGGADGQIIVWQ
jgi:WD40 repeat protein